MTPCEFKHGSGAIGHPGDYHVLMGSIPVKLQVLLNRDPLAGRPAGPMLQHLVKLASGVVEALAALTGR